MIVWYSASTWLARLLMSEQAKCHFLLYNTAVLYNTAQILKRGMYLCKSAPKQQCLKRLDPKSQCKQEI